MYWLAKFTTGIRRVNGCLLLWYTNNVVSTRGRTYSYDGCYNITSHTPYRLYRLSKTAVYLFFQTADYSIEYDSVRHTDVTKLSVVKTWNNTYRSIRYEKSDHVASATRYDNYIKLTVVIN